MTRALLTVLVLGIGAACVAACSGAQTAAQAQLAAISAGCEVSLAIEHDGGEAGAADATSAGCKAALKAWEK